MPLTNDQISIIRRRYIRDLWIPAVPNVSAAEGMSHYNLANRRQFISDPDLSATADDVTRAYRDELSGVYEDEFTRLRASGLADEAADVEATALQQDAFFRLIRCDVREAMMEDPGFQGSIADNDQRTSLFAIWKSKIIRDRQFTRQRTTPALRSLPLERG
jgi:hypothetical protein